MELQEKKKNRTEQKTDMQNKEKALLTQLDEIAKQDLCLAFSGGVDSSLLLKLVMDASAKYGTKVYAVTFQTRQASASTYTAPGRRWNGNTKKKSFCSASAT